MIQILTTGGTIEGVEYNDINEAPIQTLNTTIIKLLRKVESAPKYRISRVFLKDSRFITDTDRKVLALKIRKCKVSKIMISHGTLTMVETVKYLGAQPLNKTVVVTGAFISGNHPETDAVQNLEFALKSLTNLEKGIYIAMQNTLFEWDNVVKNIENNRFEFLTK